MVQFATIRLITFYSHYSDFNTCSMFHFFSILLTDFEIVASEFLLVIC